MSTLPQKTAKVDLQSQLLTQDILERSKTQPVYLSSVEVVGGEPFSNEFFRKLLSPLTDTNDYTLNELLERISIAHEKLVKTDVFKSINVGLISDNFSTIPEAVRNYNKDKSIITKVHFDLEPVCLNVGEVFLNLNSDDNLNVNLNYLNNNFNENAELVNFGVSYNPYKPNQHLVANGRFLANLNDPSLKFLIDFFNTHQNNQAWQQASEKSFGSIIGLQYTSKSKKFFSLSGVSLLKRILHDIEDASPDDLKYFSGDYLKSSIVNHFSYSSLSYLNSVTKNFPIDGYTVSFAHELSSNQEQENPQNVSVFNKATCAFELYKSILDKSITLKSSLDFGGIFSSSSAPIHVSDRFFLGGHNSFKGFSRNCINVDGGLQFFKFGFTILGKLPSFIYSSHKYGATNLSSLEDGMGYEANPLRLYASALVGAANDDVLNNGKLASSIGCGLKYINHWANFDIGYYVAKRHNDLSSFGIKDGLQFAISIGGSNRSM